MLKYPKHDIHFMDHADSALIFRLRIRVVLDDFWLVPSAIRVEMAAGNDDNTGVYVGIREAI